jgi:ribosomal protein S18 acetylase RimI-like enzyme
MNESSPCQSEEPFRVRLIARGEVGLFFEWAKLEGWNPGRYDGPCFHDADPGAMLVGELHGKPVATISCVRYDASFGFVGQYIVKPEFRGRGLGLRLWSAGLARLAGCNVGLDGVLDQVANYEKSGFHFSHHHIRFGGTIAGRSSPEVVPLDRVPFPEVSAYDRNCFPASREAFLRSWLAQPESVALGCVQAGKLAGYGVARRAVEGHKIGPLFADHASIAEVLFLALAREAGGPVVIDVPDTTFDSSAQHLMQKHGLRELFRCARMYTLGRPGIANERVFAITSLELG